MKTLAFLSLLLVPLTVAAQSSARPSDACNPWSANAWGDAVITSQREADEYACFRRIVGSLTLIESEAQPIVLPKLLAITGDLHIVVPRATGGMNLPEAVAVSLPALQDVLGDVTLEYVRAGGAVADVR